MNSKLFSKAEEDLSELKIKKPCYLEDLLNNQKTDGANENDKVQWCSCDNNEFTYTEMRDWLVKGKQIITPMGENNFCDSKLLEKVLLTKQQVFDKFDVIELSKARTRANPYELIKSAFFMNRAALKMANIDAVTDFMFTDIDKNPDHRKQEGCYYFADVCAGPGGFSEYILWRKKWAYKGFGFTLKGTHDFKLQQSQCCNGENFKAYYGSLDDGNIFCPDNIKDFAKKVLCETENTGVHFMMSDGGFSVEGHEDLQEILSNQIYACQCLTALEIVRSKGHFVTKLFDVFTLFSVGLLYLMHLCFENIAIIKPCTSRPANSERYLVCKSLKKSPIVFEVRKYLRLIVDTLWDLKNSDTALDVNEIVPLNIIKNSINFSAYISERNNRLCENQIANLIKLARYCKDSTLIDARQEDLRISCLCSWNIPNINKIVPDKLSPENFINQYVNRPDYLQVKTEFLQEEKTMMKIVSNITDWHYVPISNINSCTIFIGISGTETYKLQRHKWVKVKSLKLIKGTVVFGEIVTEKCIHEDSTESEIRSLQIIDALRLGDTSLADLSFEERIALIKTYCKALNYEPFETYRPAYRIRSKIGAELRFLKNDSLIKNENNQYFSILSNIGYRTKEERCVVNSILLLKIDKGQFFNTTFVLRIAILINDNEDENGYHCIKMDGLKNFIKN